GGTLLLATPVMAQQPSVTVESYGLVVSIPDTGTAIAASAFIRLRKSQAAPDTLRLDLVDMTVDSVCELRVQGCARLPFRYDGRSLALAGAGTSEREGPAIITKRQPRASLDRKSTRLNPSHVAISYAVLCSKQKTRV